MTTEARLSVTIVLDTERIAETVCEMTDDEQRETSESVGRWVQQNQSTIQSLAEEAICDRRLAS